MPRSSPFSIAAFLLSALAWGQQNPATYQISGVVVDHRTNSPLSGVVVTVAPVDARAQALSVGTGMDGVFRFPNLPTGKYALSAQQRGGRVQAFHDHGQFSTAIATGPGIDSEHIVFPLFASARIAGTVVNDEGEPVAQAMVHLLHKSIVDGRSEVRMMGQTTTSATGAFHFGHLMPGTYYLAVTGHLWYTGSVQFVSTREPDGKMTQKTVPPPAILDYTYAPAFSGDTSNGAAAQPLELPEGGSLNTQMTLHVVPSAHVQWPGEPENEGESRGGPGPHPLRGYSLGLLGPGGVIIPVSGFVGGGSTSSDIAPGSYELTRQAFRGAGPVMNSNGQDGEQVTIGPNGMSVQSTAALIQVHAQVKYNAGPAPEGNIGLALVGPHANRTARISEDGSVALGSVAPGRYRLSVFGTQAVQVQSIGEGGRTSSGNVLNVPADAPNPMNIAVTLGPGSKSAFTGTAIRDGKPAAGAMVLLVPADGDLDGFIGRDQSDSDGTFSIANVPPGQYKLLALECDSDDSSCGIEYRNQNVMKPMLTGAQDVTVSANPETSVQVAVKTPSRVFP